MIDVVISLDGQDVLARRLDTMGADIKDWSRPLRRISSGLMKTFDNNFQARGGLFQPGGWAPRKPQYSTSTETVRMQRATRFFTDYEDVGSARTRTRRRRIDTWPLLEKTGQLRKGFYGDVRGGDALVLGNRKMHEYGKYHQRGTSRLPKRTILALREADRQFVVRQFQAHLIDTVRAARG